MTEQGLGYWSVQLVGDPFDLETWRNILPKVGKPTLEIDQIDDGGSSFYLTLPNVPTALDVEEVKAMAEQEIERLNGLIMLHSDAFPIRAGSISWSTADGRRRDVFVFGDISLNLRMRGEVEVAEDGAICPPKLSDVQSWYELIEAEDLLSDAIVFFGRANRAESPWFDLYKAYEMLEKFVGGQRQRFWQRGWVEREQDELFYQTANFYRHSRVKVRRPDTPMSVVDGRELIQALLRKAFASKQTPP